MLDPRATDEAIYSHGLTGVAAVKDMLSSIGRRDGAPADSDAVLGHLDAIAECWQARPLSKKTKLDGAIGRMLDPQWWSRNLRREMLRENEDLERSYGTIKKTRECYVSNFGIGRVRARAKQNRATLEGAEVVNDDGESLNLAEVADASMSNPKLRRAELMTRCRGFEEMAEMLGHAAYFLTITCPSRFHRFSGYGPNKKWTGQTTKDAQKYLCGVWAKIRTAWKNKGLITYGFRVAEPHHEGCVHWHLLLFAAPEQVGWFAPERFVSGRKEHGAGLVGIAGKYALQDSFSETGAVKHRFTCVMIDTSKGSATGYIAKYISKNIDGLKEDGSAVGLDFASGTDAATSSERVRAWASISGIRQFQQVGGPSVTVWREMRRLKEDAENPIQLQLFEGARLAADEGNWAMFWSVQGGVSVPKSELSLKPAYTDETAGKYGEKINRVHGVNSRCGSFIKTRAHIWRIQRAGRAAVDLVDNNQRRIFKTYGPAMAHVLLNFDLYPLQSEATWTGVNNCTDQLSDDDLDVLRGPGGLSAKHDLGRMPGVQSHDFSPGAKVIYASLGSSQSH